MTMNEIFNARLGTVKTLSAKYRRVISIGNYETKTYEQSVTIEPDMLLSGIESDMALSILQAQLEYNCAAKLYTDGLITRDAFCEQVKSIEYAVTAIQEKAEAFGVDIEALCCAGTEQETIQYQTQDAVKDAVKTEDADTVNGQQTIMQDDNADVQSDTSTPEAHIPHDTAENTGQAETAVSSETSELTDSTSAAVSEQLQTEWAVSADTAIQDNVPASAAQLPESGTQEKEAEAKENTAKKPARKTTAKTADKTAAKAAGKTAAKTTGKAAGKAAAKKTTAKK